MANGEGLRGRAAGQAQARKDQRSEQPGNEVAKAESGSAIRQMLEPLKGEIAKQLPPQIDPEAYHRLVLTMLYDAKRGPALLKCKRPTLFKALLDAARWGLMPGTDEGAVIPYGDEAVFVPQYQGLIKTFYNTGQVASVEAHLIYREDDWSLAYGDSGGFAHKPRLFDGEGNAIPRGTGENPAVLAYCYVRFTSGGSVVEFMTRQQAIEIRDTYSQSYKNAEKSWGNKPPKRDSRWHLDFDKMWLKSVVRQVAKWLPKSAVLVEMLMHDAEADSRDRNGPMPTAPAPFNPGGPAAAWEGDVTHGNGSVVQGAVESGDEWDQATPARPLDRERDLRGLHALFTEAGWGSDSEDHHAVRMEVLTALLSTVSRPLVEFESSAELDEAQADRAHRGLRKFIEENPNDPHKAILDLAESVRSTRDRETDSTKPRSARTRGQS